MEKSILEHDTDLSLRYPTGTVGTGTGTAGTGTGTAGTGTIGTITKTKPYPTEPFTTHPTPVTVTESTTEYYNVSRIVRR